MLNLLINVIRKFLVVFGSVDVLVMEMFQLLSILMILIDFYHLVGKNMGAKCFK